MEDSKVTKEQKGAFVASLVRLVRAGIAYGLPYLISWLAEQPNLVWSALGPLLQAVSRFLRGAWPEKFKWLPV
jgi:hypothetical protein